MSPCGRGVGGDGGGGGQCGPELHHGGGSPRAEEPPAPHPVVQPPAARGSQYTGSVQECDMGHVLNNSHLTVVNDSVVF